MMTLSIFRIKTARLAAIAAALGAAILLSLPVVAEETENSARDILKAVVRVHATIPSDARTAPGLGTEREGSGILIDNEGLVLTIGYLILEADGAEITTADGKTIPAAIVGYDHNTGFGLLRASRQTGVKPALLGDSENLKTGSSVLAVSFEGAKPLVPARVTDRRTFAGYWEYLLDDAIFISPPHLQYGGAALFDANGALVGVGSLFVNDAEIKDRPVPGNMFVPINGLKPILQDLLEHGRHQTPSHPWLGVYTNEMEGRVFITRTAPGGPAERAGLQAGDVIMGVGGRRIRSLEDFYRKVWKNGDAGVEVTLDILRLQQSQNLDIQQITIQSLDRYDWLKLNQSY